MIRWLAIISMLAVATGLLVNWRYPYLMDFLSYWAAAVMTVGGNPAGAYDVSLHNAVQQTAFRFDTRLPFAYPPPYLFLIAPLGYMSYPVAAALWVAVSLLAFTGTAGIALRGKLAVALAFPPVAICGISGQNGLLTAAIFIFGLSQFSRSAFRAGLILGCLVIKPQLGLLLPIAFIAAREWRAFAGASLSVITLCLASLLVWGAAPWVGFFNQSTLFASIATDGLVGWHKMASLYAAMRLIGAGSALAAAVHIAGVIMAAGLVWHVWRKQQELAIRAATLTAASLLISPYLYVYDQTVLIVGIGWLAARSGTRTTLALLYLLPATSILQFWSAAPAINLAPLAPLVMLFAISTAVRRSGVPTDARLHPHGFRTAQSSE